MRQIKAIPIILIYIFAMFFLPAISYYLLFHIFNITDGISLSVYANLISYLFLAIVSISLFGRHLLDDFKKLKLDNFNKLQLDDFNKGFNKLQSAGVFFKGVFIGWVQLILALMASNILLFLIIGETDSSENQQAIEATISAYPIIMAITTVLLAPLIEEIIFRLTLMNKTLFHPWISILFSSFLFALIHVVSARDFIFIIPYMAMGIPLGYSYYKTQNICYPIGIHLLQNLFSTLVLIFIQ